MKKVIALILIILMCLMFSACDMLSSLDSPYENLEVYKYAFYEQTIMGEIYQNVTKF